MTDGFMERGCRWKENEARPIIKTQKKGNQAGLEFSFPNQFSFPLSMVHILYQLTNFLTENMMRNSGAKKEILSYNCAYCKRKEAKHFELVLFGLQWIRLKGQLVGVLKLSLDIHFLGTYENFKHPVR